MRLIDADAYKVKVAEYFKKCEVDIHGGILIEPPSIDDMPTIDLVRCGECKWYRMEYGWNCIEYMVCGISPTHHPIRLVNDFCSYGERKETDDE